MKAIGLTTFGGPEVLRVLDLPVPEAGPGEIRIRVRAATVNPVDTLVRRGIAFVSDAEPPYVPGMDAAGVVEQIGEGTDTDLQVGDGVMAVVVVSGTHGAYAEHLIVPAESVVRIPAGTTAVKAATLPMNGLTARMALDMLHLPSGATMAVTGAAGAVGGYAVQLAKAEGFRVIADAAPKDERLVRELGADVVLLRGTGFPELVRKEIPDGVDGLVDTAGIASLAIRAVRDGGRVASSVGGVQVPAQRGIETRNTFVPQYARKHAKLDRLRELAEKGSLTPRVARTLPAEQAPEAHRLLEAGGLRGRVVLTF
ncbi:NADPH:quinone reductase-like Zn-dependent oxidoreductase [Streptomyces sp. Ag109_O5-1]|uniref:NADP-dependent oxidoreductase n=1 Tax=Streptomyces sp. Ag109_O5-1 TaxID=1938851 RepID=UPI000F517138|nr:NADP-dependent oxidoreductase [Streptomyces sp. Ag109_O5-1]RPE37579.1 NADPH:quinone reductase-like Zn-dependent oxidoreductase [Streptomyces sp. Ag109_O5-1]